jgi:uracil-DNA glycosylase
VNTRERTLALDRHRAALARCRRCRLTGDIRPVVSQAIHPRVMLVGQAPGKVEAGSGKPFSGRAGRTLFRWFADVGIEETVARRRIYIAAITRCFPGSSPSGRGDRLPSAAQVSNCASWLDAEIELIAPRVIIPVGRLAIERFLGGAPLATLVGRAHRLAERRGAPIAIPLPHPSGASSWIHAPGHMDLVRSALALVAEYVPQLVRESRQARVA